MTTNGDGRWTDGPSFRSGTSPGASQLAALRTSKTLRSGLAALAELGLRVSLALPAQEVRNQGLKLFTPAQTPPAYEMTPHVIACGSRKKNSSDHHLEAHALTSAYFSSSEQNIVGEPDSVSPSLALKDEGQKMVELVS